MKKLSFLSVALLPVIYGLMIAICIKIDMSDDVFFTAMGIYLLMGIAFPILYSVTNAKTEAQLLADNNLWFYGGNMMLFIAEIVFWLIRLEENRIASQNGAMEGGLGLFLMIIVYLPHWISFLFTRIAGAIGCARALRSVYNQKVAILHTILHLFPVLGLISAAWAKYRLRYLLSDPDES